MTADLKSTKDDSLVLNGLSGIEMQAIACKAVQKLNWNLFEITPENLTVYTSKSIVSSQIKNKLLLTFNEVNEEIRIYCQPPSNPEDPDYTETQQDIQRLKETVEQIKTEISTEELADLTADLKDMFASPNEEERLPFHTAFIPRKGFMATPILIDINILVFILMTIAGVGLLNPTGLDLIQWGADFGPLTLTGDWWRTLTCNFVHIGILHILMNMYALLYIGVLLEPLLGIRRMLASYLLTGLCSAVCSLFWHSELISAGASGAIFGLYGVFLSLLFFHCIERRKRKALLSSILIFVAFNLLYGLKGGIDNAAHIGGLISGILLGGFYSFDLKQEKKIEKQYIVSTIGEICILMIYVVSFIMLTQNVPSDYDMRHEWNSEREQLSEKPQKPQSSVKVINSRSQLPPYVSFSSSDTWLNFHSEKAGISLQYPSNWKTSESTRTNYESMLLQQNWLNAGNRLTLTVSRYATKEDYEYNKKLSLTIPRNIKGEPSEDYKRSTVKINDLEFIRTNNMQHFGAPDEEGYELLQSVLNYFSPQNRMIYTFVMIINDEPAGKDLNDILENVRFENPQ